MRQAQLTLANVYFDRGQVDKARERIQEVIDRYPDFAGAYRAAGDVEYRTGRLVQARARYAAAYELEPDTFGAASLYVVSVELGDRAAAKWDPQTGAVANPDQGPRAAFRRPTEGFRYFLVLLDVASRSVQLGVVHPESIPSELGELLPALPGSVAATTIEGARTLRLPR